MHMRAYCVAACLLLQVIMLSDALPLFIRGRPPGGMLRSPLALGAPQPRPADLPPAVWLTQRLDHFRASDTRTWQQVGALGWMFRVYEMFPSLSTVDGAEDGPEGYVKWTLSYVLIIMCSRIYAIFAWSCIAAKICCNVWKCNFSGTLSTIHSTSQVVQCFWWSVARDPLMQSGWYWASGSTMLSSMVHCASC